ncbi:MAG: substrate-binding domain-containing protein [Nitrospirota bacterium]|nr:substrate-binding domain-containing protein [Nitrospirota bacterium]
MPGRKMNTLFSLLLSLSLFLPGNLIAAEPQKAAEPLKDVLLATTTSTQDSGLLDVLIPAFEKKSGYTVKTLAMGSGQAITMGEMGEIDVVLAHSPKAEEKFVAGGSGINRRLVMHNDFVIVGPEKDPAKIGGLNSAGAAIGRIAEAKALFVSRGDNSGTHAREKGLWKDAAVEPKGQKWYQEAGGGMGQTLRVASEKGGYCLTDRATYLALKKNLKLKVLVEGDKSLLNVYHVIEVNAKKWPAVNGAGAKAFGEFLVSKDAQKIIAEFGKKKFGEPLFIADAGKKED